MKMIYLHSDIPILIICMFVHISTFEHLRKIRFFENNMENRTIIP